MTADGMTPTRAREVMAEHVEHVGTNRLACFFTRTDYYGEGLPPCLPYTLAAAYVAACAERDNLASSERFLIAEGHKQATELATAQGLIDAALAEVVTLRDSLADPTAEVDQDFTDNPVGCIVDELTDILARAALTGDPQ